jgi:hypothetical protein
MVARALPAVMQVRLAPVEQAAPARPLAVLEARQATRPSEIR